jgi:hypothetical protein
MTRRGISTLALVLPPLRRSEDIIVLSEVATGGFARPDLLDLAAIMASTNTENKQSRHKQ